VIPFVPPRLNIFLTERPQWDEPFLCVLTFLLTIFRRAAAIFGAFHYRVYVFYASIGSSLFNLIDQPIFFFIISALYAFAMFRHLFPDFIF